ncbi:MAG: hypothetical protein K9J27_06625 [Bacteroidales bacterium]|nr:hypothetical protein [Bacteroidales bacterium]MCF8333740.1 hypothetical protein [Bacteroidales bacterium]
MQQFLKLTTKQCIDAGLAAVLILSLIGYFTDNVIYFHIIIPVVILIMIVPRFFYPFGVLWFGLAHLLGNVVSRIILSAIYVVFVIPVGLIRQAVGRDALQLRRFGKDKTSVFQNREHNYISKDLETPY